MAQSTAGTSLTTNAEISGARPCVKVEVAWGKKWSDSISGGDWDDETQYVMTPVTVEQTLVDPDAGLTAVGQSISYRADVMLDNAKANFRFSPFNSSSPIYNDIKDGQIRNTPIRISMGYYDNTTPEYLMQFTGLIMNQPASSTKQATVSLVCTGRDEAIRDTKARTVLYENITLTDWIEVLANLAGVSSADWSLDIEDSELQYMWLDDEYVWVKLQEAAEAAGGVIYFDHSGVLRFEGMQHWVDGTDHTSSQYTFTVSKMGDLSPGYMHSDGYSSVIVEYIRRDPGYLSVVWEDEEPEIVPPGQTIKRLARLQYPCLEIGDPEAGVDYSGLTTGGVPKNNDLTVSGTTYAAQVELEITNNGSTYAVVLWGLQLRGRPLIGSPKNEVRKITSAGYISDTKEFTIAGNQCIQSFAQADRLSEYYRDRLERVPAVFTVEDAIAKPWLEPGDRVTITVSDEGINLDTYIVSETHRYESGAYLMTLRCLEAQYLYPVSTYYNWGDNLEALDNSFPTTDGDENLGESTRIKLAQQWTATSSFTCRGVQLYLNRIGTPGGRVRVVIYDNSGGLPGSPITGGTSRWIDTGDIELKTTALVGQYYPFVLLDEPSLSNGVVYHFVLEYDSDYTFSDGVDQVSWRSENVGIGGNLEKYNGATWSNATAYQCFKVAYALPLFY